MFAQIPPNLPLLVLICIAGFILFVFFLVFLRFFPLWIQSKMAGAGVGIIDLIGMWFRKVNPEIIIRGKIMVVQAGLDDKVITTKALEAHNLSGGNVLAVVKAMIAASKAKLTELDFPLATAIDLAGRN
ncbi:MAG: flotillin-like FloA family protein, partial [Planctomycetaceae bacterium]|nr:flotillin-like FloA family protein [Planctomycetaceae bacterium]